MVANEDYVVPLKFSRNVELLVTYFQHKMWVVDNINPMAPIPIRYMESMSWIFGSKDSML